MFITPASVIILLANILTSPLLLCTVTPEIEKKIKKKKKKEKKNAELGVKWLIKCVCTAPDKREY